MSNLEVGTKDECRVKCRTREISAFFLDCFSLGDDVITKRTVIKKGKGT